MGRRAIVFLAGPRGPWVLAALGMLVAAPALRLGFGGNDDLVQRARIIGRSVAGLPPTRNIFVEFFDFFPESVRASMISTGYLPWWTVPELHTKLPRPVSVATHLLDYTLWPDQLPLQHLHSLCWYAAAILVALLVLRRVCGAPQVAALAALLFALSDTHVLPVAWLANRNSLVCFVLGGLAVFAHVGWRRAGGRGQQAVALGTSATALLAGEAALGAFGYIAAYQLFLDQGPAVRRLLRLVPYGLVVVAWQIGYRALGFGCTGLDHYQDPGSEPLAFLGNLGERLPLLLLAQWTRVSADLPGILSRPWQLVMVGCGLLVVGLLLLLFRRPLREDATARFWAGGMILSLVPVCAVYPMDRQLLFPGLGAFALLAQHVARLGWIGEAGPATAARRGTRLAVGALLVVHVLLAPIAFPLRIEGWRWMLRAIARADQAVSDEPAVAGQSIVWLLGNDFGNMSLFAARGLRGAPLPRGSHVISTSTTGLTITRRDARTLVVQPDGGFLPRTTDRAYRPLRRPFQRGERVSTIDFGATVDEVLPDGRPQRVSFRFRAPLEDSSFRWLYVGDGFAPRTFRLPRVGETVRIPAPRWRERAALPGERAAGAASDNALAGERAAGAASDNATRASGTGVPGGGG